MTARKAAKGSFTAYLSQLKKIEAHVPALVCLYGTSDCLLEMAVDTLRKTAAKNTKPCLSLEGGQLNEERLDTVWLQQSLFDEETVHFIRRAEQSKTLAPFLKRIKDVPVAGHKLVLIWRMNQLSPSLSQELRRLNCVMIPCLDPFPGEIIQVISKLADLAQIKLDRTALSLLMAMNGTNLTKHKHDILQLSLIWNESEKLLDAANIAPTLGLLRQDDAFQLDKLLAGRDWPKAHALVEQLIQRGESPLAIVGLIANHCRTAIKLKDALSRGCPSHNLPEATGLPQFITKIHLAAMTEARVKERDPDRHVRGLKACQKADLDLKSTRIPDTLIIGGILKELEA